MAGDCSVECEQPQPAPVETSVSVSAETHLTHARSARWTGKTPAEETRIRLDTESSGRGEASETHVKVAKACARPPEAVEITGHQPPFDKTIGTYEDLKPVVFKCCLYPQ